MDLHLYALYGWSQQQISNKINFSRPARNTEYLELEIFCSSFLFEEHHSPHTQTLYCLCCERMCCIAANMLLPMIYPEEVNGCRYVVVSSDYYFWEFALRTRVTLSVERIILRICSRKMAYTFSPLSFSKD